MYCFIMFPYTMVYIYSLIKCLHSSKPSQGQTVFFSQQSLPKVSITPWKDETEHLTLTILHKKQDVKYSPDLIILLRPRIVLYKTSNPSSKASIITCVLNTHLLWKKNFRRAPSWLYNYSLLILYELLLFLHHGHRYQLSKILDFK